MNTQTNLKNDEILINANFQKEFIQIINNFSNITKNYFNHNISITPTKINLGCFSYYSNFLLVTEDVMKSLFNKIYSTDFFFYCDFGDNKIFRFRRGPQEYKIEVYDLDKYNKIIPEMIYKFYSITDYDNSYKLLKEEGYFQYTNHYILFSQDEHNNNTYNASPIFDKNNKEIGYAYKYNPIITDYTPHIINNEYKTYIKLYFH